MTIELSTRPGTTALTVLDLQIAARRNAGQSQLFFRLLFQDNRPVSRLDIPPLSWFEAHQLRQFLQQITRTQQPKQALVELQDAGIRLVGSVEKATAWSNDERIIRVSSLSTSVRSFSPFTVRTTGHDLKNYAGTLQHRLWESFLKG